MILQFKVQTLHQVRQKSGKTFWLVFNLSFVSCFGQQKKASTHGLNMNDTLMTHAILIQIIQTWIDKSYFLLINHVINSLLTKTNLVSNHKTKHTSSELS